MPYFITPRHSVALNAKVASSALARSIIAAFYPEKDILIETAAYPANLGPGSILWHFFCPIEQAPSKPVVLVVREPVARFRASMAQTRLTDVNATLAALEENGEVQLARSFRKLREDVHFKHQHTLAQPSAKVFRLESLSAAAAHIGLASPLPVVNEATGEKPTLTQAQEARVLAYYADDKALYDAIPAGGMEYAYSPPATPLVQLPIPASITATQIRLWLVRNGISMQQVAGAISSISDAKAKAEAEVQWEYAPYVERTNPLVGMIAAGFGMSDAAVDQAFREASEL